MNNKKKKWGTFLVCILLFYIFVVMKLIWWQVQSQAITLSLYTVLLILLAIVVSICTGALIMTSMNNVSSDKAILWSIVSSIFPPAGLIKYITLKNSKIIKFISIISLSAIYIFCGIQLISNTSLTKNMNMGIISLNSENKWGNQLQIDFKSATKDFVEKKEFELKNTNSVLYLSGECGEGSFMVDIVQGNTNKQWIINQGEFEKKIPLNFLDKGSFTLNIHIQNAKNTSLTAKIQEK